MRTIRLYYPGDLNPPKTLDVPSELSHRLKNVLRLPLNQPLTLFNGDGHEYQAILTSLKPFTIDIQSKHSVNNRSPLSTHLGQALVHGDKMDLILQKATELGVTAITPIITERSAPLFPADRLSKKMDHWHKILYQACEQSGRTELPTLHSPTPLLPWISTLTNTTRLRFEPKASQPLKNQPLTQAITLLIGPEGGFSPQEETLATDHGFLATQLGPRILRVETAALASLTAIQCLAGDL